MGASASSSRADELAIPFSHFSLNCIISTHISEFYPLQNPTELIYEHLSGPEPEEIPAQDQLIASHPLFRQAGQELLAMADEFARSRERQQLRQRAQSLEISLINRENIFSILEELFHGGVTRERLVVLFVFCSDLIISVLRNRPASGIRWEILSWLWEFFCERICAWVQRHGGWERVLCFYLPKAVFVTTGVAITAGIVFYIWKNW